MRGANGGKVPERRCQKVFAPAMHNQGWRTKKTDTEAAGVKDSFYGGGRAQAGDAVPGVVGVRPANAVEGRGEGAQRGRFRVTAACAGLS